MECSRDGCLCQELCQSDHCVLGHLSDQGRSPPIAQFVQAASYKKSLGDFKLLQFKNVGGHFVLGDLQCCRHFLVQKCFGTLPQICASTQSYRGALLTIPSTSWLGFCSDMHCQLWDLIYRQVCAFPNHVQSIECTTGGLRSSCRS